MAKKSQKRNSEMSVSRQKSPQSPWVSNVLQVFKEKLGPLQGLDDTLRQQVDDAVWLALAKVVHDKHFSIDATQRVNFFLSYRRTDAELVTSYFEKLKQSPFVNEVFIDTESIDAGEDIGNSINVGLDEADVVLLALTRDCAASDWVMTEIQKAKKKRKLLIPILLDEALLYDVDEAQLSDDEAQRHDDESRKKRKAKSKQDLLALLKLNCIRAFSMLPCEVIHHVLVRAQCYSGIVGRVTALKIMASYDITDDQYEIMIAVITETYRNADIKIFEIERAIRVGETILLSNRAQNDTSPKVLECLINFYLLRMVRKSGSDVDTRHTYDNIIKLLFRLIHKKNPLPSKKYSFEPEKAHNQDLELLFRMAQVLIRQNKYVEAFEICEKLCKHPDISIPCNKSLRSVITYTALGLAYEIEMYIHYYEKGKGISLAYARENLTGCAYMDLNVVSRIVQSTRKQFEEFGERDLTQPWKYDNVFCEITNPFSRPKFAGRMDPIAPDARNKQMQTAEKADPAEEFRGESKDFHNIVYLATEFVKQLQNSLNMIGHDITTLSAPWLLTTMGEVKDFFLHDSVDSIESFYNALLKRKMTTNYGEQAKTEAVNYSSWVELDYNSRVRQVIYASFYNALKNLYRAGLFNGDDMTQPSAEILKKELQKLFSPPDLVFEEIPWHESGANDDGSFLRRFQYQAVYIMTELSLFLRCVMPIEKLKIHKENVGSMIEIITAFWHEKIKNPAMLFDCMGKKGLNADSDTTSTEFADVSPDKKKTETTKRIFETSSPAQKLDYQILFSILATLRKVSFTKDTVLIVKNKLGSGSSADKQSN